MQWQINEGLGKAHSISSDVYNLKIMNDIIYAMPTQLVSVFKDYLYFDDPTEYLRRNYDYTEAVFRMPKIHAFHELNSFEENGFSYNQPHILGSGVREILNRNIKKKRKAWHERCEMFERQHEFQESHSKIMNESS